MGGHLGGGTGPGRNEKRDELLHGLDPPPVESVAAEGLGVENPRVAPIVGDEAGDRFQCCRRTVHRPRTRFRHRRGDGAAELADLAVEDRYQQVVGVLEGLVEVPRVQVGDPAHPPDRHRPPTVSPEKLEGGVEEEIPPGAGPIVGRHSPPAAAVPGLGAHLVNKRSQSVGLATLVSFWSRGGRITAPIVVVGGGVAGLGAAVGLARSGFDVTVVDRDPLRVASSPEEAFALDRKGAPQVRHTHGLLARLTTVLRDRYPDVLDALIGAGGVEIDLARRFGDSQDGDEGLRVLLARRTTLEWALRRAAADEPRITVRDSTGVASLFGAAGQVRGVVLDSGERMAASTVVAAGGRRAGVVRWLADLGVTIPEEEHDTGIVYLTRWYRANDRWDRVMGGEEVVKLGGDLGYLFYLAVPAEEGTFSLTMAIGSSDSALRAQLTTPDGFDRAAAALPLPEGILSGLVPAGPVHPMGGLVNRIRRFVAGDGLPLVTGFLAAGDAHTCTNPIYGRGCSLALVHAVAVVDAMVAEPTDLAARLLAYEDICRAETEPWYHLSVQTDRARRRATAVEGSGGDPREPNPMERLLEIGSDDPIIGRAILRAFNVLATPQQLMTDPALVARVMELVAARSAGDGAARSSLASAERWVRRGPTRDEMLELTAA